MKKTLKTKRLTDAQLAARVKRLADARLADLELALVELKVKNDRYDKILDSDECADSAIERRMGEIEKQLVATEKEVAILNAIVIGALVVVVTSGLIFLVKTLFF